jgi:peptidoglycan/LPS O-acetylase OafA/YrhL
MGVASRTVELPLLRPQQRAQADTARLPALDALRAVGAIAVVGTHVGFSTGAAMQGYWAGFLSRLDCGVAIFFSLSGFLLFRPFANSAALAGDRPSVWRYLWRRALRILPAYWAAATAYILLVAHPAPATWRTWVEHLTLTQVYGYARFTEGFSHTWSLCTEVVFYLLLPIVALLVLSGRWRPMRIITVLVVVGAGTTIAWLVLLGRGVIPNPPGASWLPSYAMWFAAGMALATAHVALQTGTATRALQALDELASAPLACWTVAFAALALANTPLAGPRDLSPTTAGAFAAKLGLYLVVGVMLLIPLAFGPRDRLTTRAFASPPARWLGTISYGLFLWHPLVVALIYRPGGRLLFTGDPWVIFALVLGGGVVLASISYYVIELPWQKLAARMGSRRHPPPQ